MGEAGAAPTVRRVELVAVLSLVSDLGMGQPLEHALRQCLIALRLGEHLGIDDDEREAAFYAGLLAWVGCHIDAYEQAKWFGDDLTMKADVRHIDFASASADLAFVLRRLGTGRSLVDRLRAQVAFVRGGGMADMDAMLANHCQAADGLAEGLGLNPLVRRAIEQTFERWDGRGAPRGAAGDEILPVSSLVNLADVVEIYHRLDGIDAARRVARDRSGTQFDPAAVDAFVDVADDLFAGLDGVSAWDEVIAADPTAGAPFADDELDDALGAVADFADVKSPFTIGHSRGVADLAAAAADHTGLPAADVRQVRRAALVHDLGRLGVPNSVWDNPGALSVTDIERMRMHPYLTERTLASSPGLAALGAVAAQHHERLDGSGYPRGLRQEGVGVASRLLAAADLYRAKTEERPHRPALPAAEAATHLRDEVRSGRIDADAADAVLAAAGHRRRRKEPLAGLTPRQVEVLCLLAQGLATKQIARRLGISAKTAGNHVEHIYAKLGVSNRALASLAAARLGLVEPGGGDDQALA